MMRSRTPTPDSPMLADLARRVASGELRGRAAEEAIVDVITANEVAPDAHPRMRASIRQDVEAVVRSDAVLAALLRAPPPQSQPPAAHPTARRPASTARPAAAPHEVARPSGGRRRRPPAAAPEPQRQSRVEAEADDFAARQRWTRILSGLGVLALGGLLAMAWLKLRPGPCDELAQEICLRLDECETAAVREQLDAKGVADETCTTTMTAMSEAITGIDPAKATPKLVEAMRSGLGFDPRGIAMPDPDAAKKPTVVEPVVVAQGEASMTSLFVDDAFVYWSRSNPAGVFRVRSIGGTPELLGQQPDPIDVTATRDFVYWVSQAGQVAPVEAQTEGGEAEPVPEAAEAKAYLWTDKKRGEYEPMPIETEGLTPVRAAFLGPEVAFVDKTTGAIMIAAVAGGAPRKLADGGLPAPVEIVGDDVHVVWAGAAGTIAIVPRAGGTSRVLAQGQQQPRSLALDDTHVYWVDRGAHAVRRVPTAGGEVTTLFENEGGVWALAVDAENVYVTLHETGKLVSAPKTGGTPKVMAQGSPKPRFVALDKAAVYWEAGGTIKRLPK